MRNHKKFIGLFRLFVYIICVTVFDMNFDTRTFQFWVSDVIHGAHTEFFRNSGIVTLIMFLTLSIASYYIIQTFVYIVVGNQLSGKNTGIIRFLKYVFIGLRDCFNDPHFWSSDSNGGNLSNIERVMSYRDNKMAFMDNKRAAEYMKGTGYIDMMISRPDLKQSQKTLSYLNNKLAFMDNETAIKFLKNQ